MPAVNMHIHISDHAYKHIDQTYMYYIDKAYMHIYQVCGIEHVPEKIPSIVCVCI